VSSNPGAFKLTDVERLNSQSKEITPNPQEVWVGIASATVTCVRCGAAWHATPGTQRGEFSQSGRHLFIQCQDCDVEEFVPIESVVNNATL